MKITVQGSILHFVVLGVVLLTAQAAWASGESVLERINGTEKPFERPEIETALPLALKTVQVKEPYQGGTFRVLARKDAIERFRCSRCHNDREVLARAGGVVTHADIKINHGYQGDSLSCADCHHDKAKDFLVGKKDRKVDFDHSYQLCGKCHFRQQSDWVGGAHGKRVKYWAGERVVYNCASCHNPHSPRFKKRMPATFSRPLD